MRRDCIQILVACTILSMGRPAIRAAEFAGGKGEPNDPYLIATAEQLIAIGSDSSLLSKHFLMIQDIDLDPNLSAAYAFDQAVIGGGFRGVFDGGGFLIRHLTIRASEDGATGGRGSWLGLFRTIEQYGEVRHVVLDEVDILGSPDRDYVGALCSANKGVLRQCFVGGTVFGWTVGGMVGWNQPDGSVQECGSVCTVSGTYSGGLIGSNHGWAEDSYASGAVSGTQCGGLVAEAAYGSRISRCYASCRVISVGPYSGGLIGTAYPGTVADGCFFLGYRDGGGPDNGIGRALTLDQMKQVASFVGWEFWGTGNDGLRAPWSMPEDGYPELTWLALGAIPGIRGLSTEEAWKALAGAGIQTCYVTYDYDPAVEYGHAVVARPNLIAPAGRAADVLVSLGCYDWSANSGTGEPNDPYLILSPGQLECLAVQPRLWSKCFRLISDLDMAWRVHKRPLIGIGGAFSGVFEGDGYLIRNLTFETRGPDGNWSKMLGLFGEVGPLGEWHCRRIFRGS